uniref:Uncharacterized protein n=1 Tax=Amorphochlora amoebiformis TaxID=1561963 RepID=A0A7S0GPP1_9EUKA|mmetsp:Transcript_12938/g.20473  ORF Transcript_12938/g.20473 Transcript_12938/m.20473 type:complete len:918 (+) Transcript_12938:285-3038(+)
MDLAELEAHIAQTEAFLEQESEIFSGQAKNSDDALPTLSTVRLLPKNPLPTTIGKNLIRNRKNVMMHTAHPAALQKNPVGFAMGNEQRVGSGVQYLEGMDAREDVYLGTCGTGSRAETGEVEIRVREGLGEEQGSGLDGDEVEGKKSEQIQQGGGLLSMFEQEGPFNIVASPDPSICRESTERLSVSDMEEFGTVARDVKASFVGVGGLSDIRNKIEALEDAKDDGLAQDALVAQDSASGPEQLVQSMISMYRREERKRRIDAIIKNSDPHDPSESLEAGEFMRSGEHEPREYHQPLGLHSALGGRKGGGVGRPKSFTADRSRNRRYRRQSAVVREVKLQREKECTFKPRINDKYQASRVRPNKFSERINQLTNSWATRGATRSAQKKREEQEELAECSFRPNVGADGKEKPSLSNFEDDLKNEEELVPVEDRLLEHAVERIESRYRIKKSLEEDQLKQCTFTPHINAKSREYVEKSNKKSAAPIYRRLGQIQKEREQKDREVRKRAEKAETLSFKPVVNKTSSALVKLRRKGLEAKISTEDRLLANLESNLLRKLRRQARVEHEMDSDLTFKPKLCPASQQMADKDESRSNNNFYDRQMDKLNKKQAKVRAIINNENKEKGYSFKPDIGNAKKVLQNSLTLAFRFHTESNQDRYERLSVGDRVRFEKRREELQKQMYKRYDFKPKINESSRKMAVERKDIYELVYDSNREKSIGKAKHVASLRLKEECKFKPTLLTKGNKISSKWKPSKDRLDLANPKALMQAIETKRRRKEYLVEKYKSQRDLKLSKECTFAPKTNKSIKTGPDVVVVRGMAKFMQNRQLAKQLEAEKRKREDQVFGYKYSGCVGSRSGRPLTVPKPFKLSKPTKQKNKPKTSPLTMKKGVVDLDGTNCTFKPKTLGRSNRDFIARILREDDNIY